MSGSSPNVWRGRRSWRTLAPAARVLLVLVCALSCARKTASEREQVVFWVSWPVSAIEPLARRFEAENPGLEVALVQLPWQTGADSVALAVKAGAPPDLCQLHSSQLPPFMAGSSLSDWSAGVADLRAGLRGWDMVMVGDAIYGLPWLLRTQALFYNKALFARAGLDSAHAPGTWSESRTAATRIQHLRHGVHGYGLPERSDGGSLGRIMPYAWSNGGELLSAALDSSRFDSPANIEALEFLRSLRPVSLWASEDSLQREFVGGRLGMMLASSDLSARILHTAPLLRYGVALVPRPAADRGTHASLAGGEVMVSFTSSRHKENALKLARFLVRPENASGLATALHSVQPANLGADSTTWYRVRPEQQLMFRQYETARFLPNIRERMAIDDTLQTLLDDCLGARRTAAQVVAMADTFITTHRGPR